MKSARELVLETVSKVRDIPAEEVLDDLVLGVQEVAKISMAAVSELDLPQANLRTPATVAQTIGHLEAIIRERGKEKPVFDESKPHTLADFVAASMKYSISCEGLPNGITVSQAGEAFGKMYHVDLKPIHGHYFCGRLPTEGKKVQTNGGVHLFTIISTEFITQGHRLIIEPAAQELLKEQQ